MSEETEEAEEAEEAEKAEEVWLSLVIPVRDEVDSLEPLHREIDAVLGGLGEPSEVIFVDDASGDGSHRVLAELARKDPRVRVLTLAAHEGQCAALDAGFRAVRGCITATLDADGQNDPADFPRLLAALDHADVVNGVRTPRCDSRSKIWASKLANGVRNWLTHESVSDVGCSLRVMRTSYLRRVKLVRGMHRFLPTLLRLEGARVVELPVAHRARQYGSSKYGIRGRLFEGIVDLLAVRWMLSRSPGDKAPPRRG